MDAGKAGLESKVWRGRKLKHGASQRCSGISARKQSEAAAAHAYDTSHNSGMSAESTWSCPPESSGNASGKTRDGVLVPESPGEARPLQPTKSGPLALGFADVIHSPRHSRGDAAGGRAKDDSAASSSLRSKSCTADDDEASRRTSRPACDPQQPRTETSAVPLKFSKVFACESGGSVCLSTCPGKKLAKGRNGKAYHRSLKHDLASVQRRVPLSLCLCLLNHSELRTLGVRPDDYACIVTGMNMRFQQYPMIEMSAPKCCAEFDEECIKPVIREVSSGGAVLIHCRGGVGRAGLLAACSILRVGEVRTADEAIAVVRQRRDPRAVESQTQINFVNKYAQWLRTTPDLESLHLAGTLPTGNATKAVAPAQPGVRFSAARRGPPVPFTTSGCDNGPPVHSGSFSVHAKPHSQRRSASSSGNTPTAASALSHTYVHPPHPPGATGPDTGFDTRHARRSQSQCVTAIQRQALAPSVLNAPPRLSNSRQHR